MEGGHTFSIDNYEFLRHQASILENFDALIVAPSSIYLTELGT